MTDEDFCAMYEAHARRLWAYVARATGDTAAADDIVQEAFMRVFEARRLNSATAEHRRRYLYKVATNLIRRRHRTPEERPLEESSIAADGEALGRGASLPSAETVLWRARLRAALNQRRRVAALVAFLETAAASILALLLIAGSWTELRASPVHGSPLMEIVLGVLAALSVGIALLVPFFVRPGGPSGGARR